MQNCLDCGKVRHWRRTGKVDERGAQIRKCCHCGREQAEPPPQGIEIPPSVLYFDIETSKMTFDGFSPYVGSKYISWKNIKERPYILCFAAQWKGNDRIMSHKVTPDEAKARDDSRVVTELWKLLNAADYIVGHNSKGFDTKKAHLRFILNDMPAPNLIVKQQDTFRLARKYFRNDSDALGYWLSCFGETGKDKMTESDWDLCMEGNESAMRKMVKYCRQDVRGGMQVLERFERYLASGGVRLFV